MTKTRNTTKDPSYAPIIFNPKSGTQDGSLRKKQLLQKLAELGWNGEFINITTSKNAGVIARELVDKKKKHIVVCGGDGTVREALEQIINTDTTLGIIPIGTGNILAKNIGIPVSIEEAIAIALYGKIRKIDVGLANGNVFAMTASMGIGVDAMIGANPQTKKRFGLFAYFSAAYKKATTPLTRYKIILDKKTSIRVRAKGVIAANVGSTVGGITLAPGAGLQSGDLKIAVVKARWYRDWINLLYYAYKRQIHKSQYYDVLNAQSVEIIPVHGSKRFECDGTDFPAVPRLIIDVLPKAAKIMVPGDDYVKRLMHKNENILIFDFDGTIADTFKLLIKTFNNVGDSFGYQPLSPSHIEKLRGHSAREVIDILGINKFQLPRIYAQGRKEFLKHTSNIAAFAGMKEILVELSKNYGLGIVTSNDTEIVAQFLKRNNMEMFNFIYSDKTMFGKGAILKHLLDKYKFDKEKVIYIGDEVRDIDAAREAGIKVTSVTWGFNTKEALQSHKPDNIVDTPRQLADFFSNDHES